MKRLIRRCVLLAIAVGLQYGLATGAQATQPVAPAVTGPDYSVTYENGYAALSIDLYESYQGGSWQHVASGGGTVAFTGKPAGAYSYMTVEMFVYYDEYWFPYYYYWNSPPTLVNVVSGPLPGADPLATQNGYTYETRSGDFDGNGWADLFVRKTSGGSPGNGTIDSVILQNSANGSFTHVVPSAAQASAATSWSLVNANLALQDFNLDGFMDIVLKDLGNVIGGALGQVVVAPGPGGGLAPQRLVAMDAKYTNFGNEVGNFVNNPYWYSDTAISSGSYWWQPVYALVQQCSYEPYWTENGYWYDYYCWYEWVVVGYNLIVDYSPFDQDGVQIAGAIGSGPDGWPVPDIAPGTANARSIDQVLQRVFGVRFMRGQLDTPCIPTHALSYDSDTPIPCEDDTIGEILLAALGTITERGSCRPLTGGEISGGTSEGLMIMNVTQVRVCNQGFMILGRWDVMAPNGHIYIGPANHIVTWAEDYSVTGTRPFSVLIHELTHVYQVRTRGCHLACMGIKKLRAWNDYDYTPFSGGSYFSYNMEEQAAMIQDRFLLRRGQPHWRAFETGDATLPQLEAVIPF
jgi:hypothetical protein